MLNFKKVNMKNLIVIVSVCFLFITLISSCERGLNDFLDKAPGVDVTEDTIFSSKSQLETFIAGTYLDGMNSIFAYDFGHTGQILVPFSSASDESEAAHDGWFNTEKWNAGLINSQFSFEDDRWEMRWRAIRRVNILMDRVNDVPGIDENYKKQVTGEALFIRALNYFEMVKRYGGVPIIDRRLGVDDNLKIPRATIEECFNFIVHDCDSAVTLLPDNLPAIYKGKASKGAALALKAKALLYAASPIFNSSSPYLSLGANNNLICYGNYELSRWQKAADAAKAVIDWAPKGGCSLVTDQGADKNYKYVWEINDNQEIILANKSLNDINFWFYPWIGIMPGCFNWGGRSVPMNFVKLYERKDGTPQTWDFVNGGNDLNQKYAELDPRFKQSFAYDGTEMFWDNTKPIKMSYSEPVDLNGDGKYSGPGESAAGPHLESCETGAWVRKFHPDALVYNIYSYPVNDILFRLAEAYLNYAEALNEVQGPVKEAYTAVNTIRERSGMPDLPTGLSKDEFRIRVRNERAVELAYEEHRFWDVRRWLIAENEGVMQGNFWGIKIFKIPGSTELKYQPFVFETRIFHRNMYLHPFLQGEVNKGYLVQNPGY